jgi:catechol 2,3-dioxygenase-like lactoylglutathione lyase family enzyme
MVHTELNHVSVVARDLERSTRFYGDLFDFEAIPTPNFDFEAQWLEMGDGRQLHLFDLESDIPKYHHFGVTVADLEAVYYEAKDRGILTDFSDAEDSYQLYSLPDGAVQMYVEDPAGNVIEVNWPDVESLSGEIQEEIIDRGDLVPQTDEAAEASLHLTSPSID